MPGEHGRGLRGRVGEAERAPLRTLASVVGIEEFGPQTLQHAGGLGATQREQRGGRRSTTAALGATVVPLAERQVEGLGWEPWLDEAAVARYFGVSTRTVRRWQHAGMPSAKYGGVRRYRLSGCELWLRGREGEEGRT